MKRYDATGIDASGGFPIITKPGWYAFKIVTATEGLSKNGDYQVTVDTVCLHPEWKDFPVRQWVTFLPKVNADGSKNRAAGMAVHFLKCIEQPYEGVFDIKPLAWEGKNFMGKVIVSEYKGKPNNKFAEIAPMKSAEQIEAMEKTSSPFESPI